MAKPQHNPDEAFGSDSFLDIVANMVGILIILVIIAGLRAKNLPQDLIDAAMAVAEEVQSLVSDKSAIERETQRMSAEITKVQGAQVARQIEQEELAQLVAEKQAALQAKRDGLGSGVRDEFDTKRALAAAQGRLSRVQAETDELKVQPVSRSTKIESYPTPLSQTVHGKEIHFQLRGGRVAYVPLNELLEEFKEQARSRAQRLREQDEATDTVGPQNGFRMRYTLERVNVPVQVSGGGVAVGSFAQLSEFTLIPTSNQLGETLEQTLLEGSDFRRHLGQQLPGRTTVTLWAYPDSFATYRAIKQNLYLQGYSVAGRPLPEGQPIGGSPQGTKSAAQ